MPDEVVADTTQKSTGEAEVTAEGQETDASGKLIFDKYKTLDEAAKGYKELEKKFTEVSTEKSRLAEMAQMNDALKALAGAVSKVNEKSEEKPPVDFEPYLESLASKWTEDPKAGLKEISGMVNSWIADEGVKSKKYADEKLTGLTNEINSLKENIIKSSSDYSENKDDVEALIKEGLSLSKALGVVKSLKSKYVPERITPPGIIGGVNASAGTKAKGNEYFSSPDERQTFIDRFGEDIVKDMEAEHKRKVR